MTIKQNLSEQILSRHARHMCQIATWIDNDFTQTGQKYFMDFEFYAHKTSVKWIPNDNF